jgi:hypothetical protein
MINENEHGSTWASVVAVLTLSCTIGIMYLPLALR